MGKGGAAVATLPPIEGAGGRTAGNVPSIEGQAVGQNCPLFCDYPLTYNAPMSKATPPKLPKGKPPKRGEFINVRMRIEGSEEGEIVKRLTPRQRVLLLIWAMKQPRRPSFPENE